MAATGDGSEDWPRVVDELRAGLLSAQGSIQHLTVVLQDEQDRRAAIEVAATSDRQMLESLLSGHQDTRRRADMQIQAVHSAARGVTATDASVREVCARLDVQSDQLSAANRQLADLLTTTTIMSKRLDSLNELSDGLRVDLDATREDARQQRADFDKLKELVDMLDVLSNDLSDKHRELNSEHAATASSLEHTLQHLLHPALEQAEREHLRLDSAEARIGTLEAQGDDTCSRVANLHATSNNMDTQHQGLSGRVQDATTSLSQLTASFADAMVQAKHDRERLEDAWRLLEHLNQGAQETHSSMRKIMAEVADVQVTATDQVDLGTKVAGQLEALRHGLKVTDTEIQDLKVILDLPPIITE